MNKKHVVRDGILDTDLHKGDLALMGLTT